MLGTKGGWDDLLPMKAKGKGVKKEEVGEDVDRREVKRKEKPEGKSKGRGDQAIKPTVDGDGAGEVELQSTGKKRKASPVMEEKSSKKSGRKRGKEASITDSVKVEGDILTAEEKAVLRRSARSRK